MYAKIEIIGHLGNDPEIRHLPSGTINGNFSVATNRPKYTDKSTGEVVTPEPTWFRVVSYQTTERGLVTEVIQKHLKKGQLVFVEGEPRIRKYTDKEGIQRQAFEVHLGPQSVIRMLGGGNGNGKPVNPAANGTMPNVEKGDPGPGDIDLGEIPI
jgi:single-strand DNA-binding protein